MQYDFLPYIHPRITDKNALGNVLLANAACRPESFLNMFLKENERCYYTSLRFPSRKVSVSEKIIQIQNYDYFVHTMAEMMGKYASDIMEGGDESGRNI